MKIVKKENPKREYFQYHLRVPIPLGSEILQLQEKSRDTSTQRVLLALIKKGLEQSKKDGVLEV